MKPIGFMSSEEVLALKKPHASPESDSLSDHDLNLPVEYLFDPEGFAEFMARIKQNGAQLTLS